MGKLLVPGGRLETWLLRPAQATAFRPQSAREPFYGVSPSFPELLKDVFFLKDLLNTHHFLKIKDRTPLRSELLASMW